MEQIILTKKNGTQIKLFSKEYNRTVQQAVQDISLMGDDTVSLSITSGTLIDFGIGDKIVIDNNEYSIRTIPSREIVSENLFSYEAKLYGVIYELIKSQYRDTDINGVSKRSTFDLTYSLKDFIKVVIYNVSRDYPGIWVFDEANCPDTEPKTLSFSKQNCLQVLQTVCNEFKFDFIINQANGIRTIKAGNFGSVIVPPSGNTHFEWGKGLGLFNLKEKKIDDKSIITRLWVEGGTKNLKAGYREFSDRLQLPYPARMNTKQHKLYDGTVIEPNTQLIGISDDAKRYIEDATMKNSIGSIEDTEYFDEIFPHRTGVISALGADIYSFVDNAMDFDLKAKDAGGNTLHLIDGVSAKITFITGKLAGMQFELEDYTHGAKTFKIIKHTDERGLSFPTVDSTAFRFVVGDKYKITDINLPDVYVENAEEELWFAGYNAFLKRKQAMAQYELAFDRNYFIKALPIDSSSTIFKPGDYIPIKDTRFGIEKNIRIQNVKRNMLQSHDYSLTLSDTTAISIYNKTVLDVLEHNIIIERNRLRDVNKARLGWRTTEELRTMVYDTDGFFDVDNIRPNSIDTNMLTVGSRSQQYLLLNTVMQANREGNANRFYASAGQLSHFTINDDGTIRTWNMSSIDTTLSQTGGYYVFAKCSKINNTGSYHITQEQLKVEDADANNYYFQVGIIGSIDTALNFRDFITTYGFTRINGNTITTGKIKSADGNTYFDLQNNEIGGNIKFKSTSGSYQNLAEWTDQTSESIKATQLYIEYSVDGTANSWHTPYQNGDVFLRQKIGVNGTWSSPIKFIGQDGTSVTIKGTVASSSNLPTSGMQVGDGYIANDTGRLWVYSSSGWVDAGVIKGDSGSNAYLHIAYADDELGNGFSQSPTGKKYMGVYTDNYPDDSSSASAYSWSLIQGAKGDTGSPGKSVLLVDVEYAVNSNSTSPPVQGSTLWKTDASAFTGAVGQVLWTRNKTTYSVGDATYTTPANITPKAGAKGDIGTGVSSIIEFYFMSSSKVLQPLEKPVNGQINPPTGWQTLPQTWEPGKYIWTCSRIIYSNPTSIVWTVPICSSEWEAVNLIEIGGVNLIKNGNFLAGLHKWNYGSITPAPTVTLLSGNELPNGVISGIKIAVSQDSNGVWQNFADVGNRLELNKEYTLSFIAKVVSGTNNRLFYGYEGLGHWVDLTTSWAAYKVTFKPTTYQNISFYTHVGEFAITNIQLELGNKASSWKQYDYVKDALEQLTEINGGLVLSSLIAVRDRNNKVRSYINGLETNPSAFAAGVEAFGIFPDETKTIDLRHDGSGHLAGGDITWDENGNAKIGVLDIQKGTGVVRVIENNIVRYLIHPNLLETLASIRSSSSDNATINLANFSRSAWTANGSYTNPNSLILNYDNSSIRFTGNVSLVNNPEAAQPIPYGQPKPMDITTLSVVLYKKNSSGNFVYYTSISSAATEPAANGMTTYTGSIDRTIYNLPVGEYRIGYSYLIYPEGSVFVSAQTFSKSKNIETRRIEFAKDGFMAFYNGASGENFLYMTESEGLKVGGNTDIPGVLLAGSVGTNGGFNQIWGAKKHATGTAIRNSVGYYTVFHAVGHSDYNVQITPETDQRVCYVTGKSANSFLVYFKNLTGALSDSNFSFQINGKN